MEMGSLEIMDTSIIKKLSISICVLVLLTACVRHADYLTQFYFMGVVKEDSTGSPLEGVEIYFADLGFDNYIPKGDPRKTYRLGVSDKDGKYDISYQYWWGRKIILIRTKPEKSFNLVFRKEGYKEQKLFFKADEYRQDDHSVRVSVKEVFMEKE